MRVLIPLPDRACDVTMERSAWLATAWRLGRRFCELLNGGGS